MIIIYKIKFYFILKTRWISLGDTVVWVLVNWKTLALPENKTDVC